MIPLPESAAFEPLSAVAPIEGSAWVLVLLSATLVEVESEVESEAEVESAAEVVEAVAVVEVVEDPGSEAASTDVLLVSSITEVELLEVRAVVVEDCIIEDVVVGSAVTLEVSDDCVEVMVLAGD